jgi:hypothetical protein
LVNPGETHAGGVRGEIGGSATGPAKEGCRWHKEKDALATLWPETGWWLKIEKISSLNHQPVRSIKGGFAIFT